MTVASTNLSKCCHNCEYCIKKDKTNECTYNIHINDPISYVFIIPDTYARSCKHFKERGG